MLIKRNKKGKGKIGKGKLKEKSRLRKKLKF